MGSVQPAQIPTSFGHELRACLRCRLVKTYDQFRESGCENCPSSRWRKISIALPIAPPPISMGLFQLRIQLGVGLQNGFDLEDLYLVFTLLPFQRFFQRI